MTIKVTNEITIKIGKQEIMVSTEAAEDLYAELGKILKKETAPYIPQYPMGPIFPPEPLKFYNPSTPSPFNPPYTVTSSTVLEEN